MAPPCRDRKSTRLNSSHQITSYAVFCLKKKTKHADILIFNVAPHTAQRIQKEFRCVELQAGYADNAGLIFSGTAIQIRRARLFFTDTDSPKISTLSLHAAHPI